MGRPGALARPRGLAAALVVALSLAGLAFCAPAGEPLPDAQPGPSTALEGHWELRYTGDGPQPVRLGLAIDAVGDGAFRARATFLMVGHTGLDHTTYAITDGRVTPDGSFRFELRGPDNGPDAVMEGTWAGDAIEVHHFIWGAVDHTADGRRWRLVRTS
jgi:hypothetical protein